MKETISSKTQRKQRGKCGHSCPTSANKTQTTTETTQCNLTLHTCAPLERNQQRVHLTTLRKAARALAEGVHASTTTRTRVHVAKVIGASIEREGFVEQNVSTI